MDGSTPPNLRRRAKSDRRACDARARGYLRQTTRDRHDGRYRPADPGGARNRIAGRRRSICRRWPLPRPARWTVAHRRTLGSARNRIAGRARAATADGPPAAGTMDSTAPPTPAEREIGSPGAGVASVAGGPCRGRHDGRYRASGPILRAGWLEPPEPGEAGKADRGADGQRRAEFDGTPNLARERSSAGPTYLAMASRHSWVRLPFGPVSPRARACPRPQEKITHTHTPQGGDLFGPLLPLSQQLAAYRFSIIDVENRELYTHQNTPE